MKIVVIGAGIVGTTTALVLARQGHRVTVLDGAADVAQGASHANAGLVSPGHCFSWAEPGAPKAAVKALFGLSDGIGICQPWHPALVKWGVMFARQSTAERWLSNSRSALRLSAYSRDLQYHDTTIDTARYDGKFTGILYLYDRGHAPHDHEADLLRQSGEVFQELDARALLSREPSLREARIGFDRATYSPHDGTGDAARYARAAMEEARGLGVEIAFGEHVRGFSLVGPRIGAVLSNRREHATDAVVVAAGLQSRALLRELGYALPIQAVSGYSITYTGSFTQVPVHGAVSIPHKIAWTAFGKNRVRFTGFADIGTPGRRRRERRFAALARFAASVLPEVTLHDSHCWLGQRPMTPDNLPIIGHGRHANLWLNCGHGAMGWTMARGSAQLIADLIDARPPAIDIAPYRWDRFW